MKTGDIVRIKTDGVITDNAGMWSIYERDRNKNITHTLKKDKLYRIQKVEHKKDFTSNYYKDGGYESIPYIISKGVYYHLCDDIAIDSSAPHAERIIGLSKEQLDIIAEPIEERLIDETIKEDNSWYPSNGEISSVIEEYADILKQNKDKYPLGIYVYIDTEMEQGYYGSCSCHLTRKIIGRRLESKQEVKARKNKNLELAKKKSIAAKKAQATKAAKEKELYKKLKTKFEKGEVNQ